MNARTLPSCSGPCGQNSANCKTPEACQIAIDDTPLGWRVSHLVASVILVGFLGALVFKLLP